MPSPASAYTEFTAPGPPPAAPKGAAGAAATAGTGVAGAPPAGGVAAPRPKMSGTPWSGSPTIALAELIRLPPPPRPGACGRRLVGRVAAAVNPPGQRSDPLVDAGEELNFVFQYIRARS